MKYYEIANELKASIDSLSNGDKVSEWLLNRFYNYELKYEPETFKRLFISQLSSDLITVKYFNEILTLTSMWELGNKVVSNSNNTGTSTSNQSQSYAGYNVEGDYIKTNANVNNENSSSNETTMINLTDEKIKILNADFLIINIKVVHLVIDLFTLLI